MKVLVVGLGSMGKRRIRLLKRFENVTAIIGIDEREDRRSDVAEILSGGVYTSIAEALKEHPQIECVFICTSPLSHSGLINEALDYNLNVFTEINLVSDGYAENMELARKKKKVLFISSTFYYREEIQYIRERLAGKSRLNYMYHVGQYLPDWHPWESYKEFFVGDKRTNGCREIMAIEFPWLIGTFGDVEKFAVLSDNLSDLNIQYRDNYMIQLLHVNGNKGTLIVDIVSPKAVRNLEIYGEGIYYSWNGSPDGLEFFNADANKIEKVEFHEMAEHIEGYEKFIVENAYENEIRDFFSAIDKKVIPQYGFEQDLNVLKLIDKIEVANE